MRIIPGLLSLSIATAAVAQDAPPIAKYVPSSPHPEHVFVFDSAHVLSTQTSAALQDSARALQTETGADIVWVTLPTLGGRPIEEAALYIGRTWRVGSAGTPGDPLRNRGLVILYVPDKTKTAGSNFRIEVGNGLEGTITDSRSRAISAAMRKDLKAKRYDEGYLAGWNVAAGLVREDAVAAGAKAAIAAAPVSPPVTQATTPDRDPGGVIAIVMMIGIGILVLLVVASRQQTASGAAPRARRRGNDNNDTSTWTPSPRVDYSSPPSMDFGSSSSFDSGSSSGGGGGGGDLGGGGGFSGGGSSDTI
jgi:uncharacterized protein